MKISEGLTTDLKPHFQSSGFFRTWYQKLPGYKCFAALQSKWFSISFPLLTFWLLPHLWQQHSHPIELNTNERLDQRLDYIHNNPVVCRYCKTSRRLSLQQCRQLCKILRKFNGGDADLRNVSLKTETIVGASDLPTKPTPTTRGQSLRCWKRGRLALDGGKKDNQQ